MSDQYDPPTTEPQAFHLAPSANGRTSGKWWKEPKSATVYAQHAHRDFALIATYRRSQLSVGRKTRSFDERMARTQRDAAVKKLASEIKADDAADKLRRRTVTKERKAAAEERQRLELAKAQMGARKAARLKKKMGRSKKVNG
ncbi:hypothetical protein BKA62DRAFT_741911 [Auriculariales sp. MPI-PUGE-AT-0066]|nr:hypothetical protein BKA62DRAFT_741911 [Auriculariales sp. MPI-PUGE-AT-0066]